MPSEAFNKKLNVEGGMTNNKLKEVPFKHRDHVLHLVKKVIDGDLHPIFLKLDPRYAAYPKTTLTFVPEAVLYKYQGVEEYITETLKENPISLAAEMGLVDEIVGVVGHGITRTGKKVPLIAKKWEFGPPLKYAKITMPLGVIYITAENRRSLAAKNMGKIAGIQVVGRGLTPNEYVLNMLRAYLDQKYIFSKHGFTMRDLKYENVAKVIGFLDNNIAKDVDTESALNEILGAMVSNTETLLEHKRKYGKIIEKSIIAKDLMRAVGSAEEERRVEKARRWAEKMIRSKTFWNWATSRLRWYVPRKRMKQLKRFVLEGNTINERALRLRLAEKSANAELMGRLL